MDVGSRLRTAREHRGLSLDCLAHQTKIPPRLIAALEDNQFHRVPPGIFLRGYLRACAGETGLPPEDVVAQYLAETGQVPPAAADAGADAPQIAEAVEEVHIDPDLSASGPGWGYVLIVAALLVAVVSVNRDATPALPDATAPRPAVPAERTDIRPAAAADVPVATTGDGLHLDLQARGPCWVEAVVDGQRAIYRLMQPGERETIDIRGEVVLRVGDPSALTYSVNGQPGEPLGATGVPITVRFTSGGARQTLVS